MLFCFLLRRETTHCGEASRGLRRRLTDPGRRGRKCLASRGGRECRRKPWKVYILPAGFISRYVFSLCRSDACEAEAASLDFPLCVSPFVRVSLVALALSVPPPSSPLFFPFSPSLPSSMVSLTQFYWKPLQLRRRLQATVSAGGWAGGGGRGEQRDTGTGRPFIRCLSPGTRRGRR